jgi:hypothetical protein
VELGFVDQRQMERAVRRAGSPLAPKAALL